MSYFRIASPKLTDFNLARDLEWLETNRLGGYAASTVSGAHSRKYHGLLVAAMHPPVGRTVLLSKLDETIVSGPQRFELSSNQYPGAIHPQGFHYLERFERNLFPEFYFNAGEIQLKKIVAAVHDENTTIILYEAIRAPQRFILELLPLSACKDFHSLAHANDHINQDYIFDNGIFRTRNYRDCPEFFIAVPGSMFREEKNWFYNFEYSVEQQRGLKFSEDLFTHGKFVVELQEGDKLGIIVSTENPEGRDAFKLFAKENERREAIVEEHRNDNNLARLALAADQFIVKRGDRNTVIAGYPWFADWGRDTMIALPGLCLVTGRFEDARHIIEEFAGYVDQGMLPNRFPDSGEHPEYNTVDATLWFFHAIYKYYQYTSDKEFVEKLLPVLTDIIEWHYKGTRYAIHVDPSDELLFAGQDGVQLTWMDAKVSDWVVTPRKGKPVEINALWYNALQIIAFLLDETTGKNKSAEIYRAKAEKVSISFNAQFWNAKLKCLYDYVDGDLKNDDVRPNQIYALSLPFKLLDDKKSGYVLSTVTKQLLTPKGLRSLSPDHKDYKPVYTGDIWSRDGSYHQGTVWSFLLGPYIDALMICKGSKGKNEARQLVNTFLEHLNEACIGSVSEIFDAKPPHTPRGCVAQAWGVGEILRVAIEHKLL